MGRLLDEIRTEIDETTIANEYKTLLLLHKGGEATELLVNQIKNREYIYTTRDDIKSEVWIYKEGIYISQGKSYIKEWIRKILKEIYTEHKSNEVIAKIEADTYTDSKEFFNQNNIDEICLDNGILNLKTKELTSFTPKKIFFNKIRINYIPNINCPNIKKHLKTVLKREEDSLVIQELFGYCLLKDYRFEKAFMLVGTGRNGKSKTLELLKNFVGIESISTVTLKELENQFSKQELFNKMVNIAGDISNETIKDSSWFKGLTGRDLVGADRKFLNKIYFTNYAKLIFSANDLPKTYDISPAFWNRWIILEFPYIFKSKKEIDLMPVSERLNAKEMDEEIIQKITSKEELTGLLNWSLEGLDRLLKNKDFSYTKSVNEVKDFWIRKSDSFMAFCLDELDFKEDAIIEKKELKKAYNEYCKYHKIKTQGDKAIKNTLDINFGISENNKRYDDDWFHVWEGIGFKNGKINPKNLWHLWHPFQIRIGKNNSIGEFKYGANPEMEEISTLTFEDLSLIISERLAKEIEVERLISLGVSEKAINLWKEQGLIYEFKNGIIKLL